MSCTRCSHVGAWDRPGELDSDATILFQLKKWLPGDRLSSVIQRELSRERVDGYRCPPDGGGCGAVDTSEKDCRLVLTPPFLLLQLDRTRFEREMRVPEKRCGPVTLDVHFSLNVHERQVDYRLAAAACHSGELATAGHWTTWRRGDTVGLDVDWVVDDDAIRRPPAPHENVSQQVGLALYVRQDAWPWGNAGT